VHFRRSKKSLRLQAARDPAKNSPHRGQENLENDLAVIAIQTTMAAINASAAIDASEGLGPQKASNVIAGNSEKIAMNRLRRRRWYSFHDFA
jgi:hypothetical protein